MDYHANRINHTFNMYIANLWLELPGQTRIILLSGGDNIFPYMIKDNPSSNIWWTSD